MTIGGKNKENTNKIWRFRKKSVSLQSNMEKYFKVFHVKITK